MKITEARMEIDGGNEAVYIADEADMPQLPHGSFVAIGVADFEEAQDLIATIDRSRAQKKRKPTEPVPSPAPVTEKAAHPPRGAGDGSGQEVTPPKEAAAKARALGNKLSEVTG